MKNAQLKLVTPAETHPQPQTRDPVARVFQHWLDMLGRSPLRCKLGPTRRRAIMVALTLYDEDTLLMAIEGNAADYACTAQGNSIGRDLNDVEWVLATESRIERFAEMGEQLRQRVDQAEQDAARPAASLSDPVEAAAIRARLKAMVQQSRRGGSAVHG